MAFKQSARLDNFDPSQSHAVHDTDCDSNLSHRDRKNRFFSLVMKKST